ncbi:MAG: Type II and III secretion system protein [Thermotoga sp. 50_1627]|uniref:type II secretion system protein GspD n=1 Tax=Pseudothermotoga sp. TaxID=2033661 RepID=UPI00076D9810|nr:MAG: Type II and III secretion system protein [Thermotoga sp. 50_64]KUK25856.1 MAG: Type II and III secretion system protein [Thermotoga sp. 50_1627]MBC7116162.1 secretin [Pseudothermotoga sp.]MDK2923575.1 hypothetical protein [Pseudothermotoga sp.]HCO98029.1 secretin [Pseudothermotoga sp.]
MRKLMVVSLLLLTAITCFFEEEPLVTNIFQDTYILDVLADISAQTGIPIIADTTVTGFVTVELTDVPLEQALKIVLMPGGYTYIKLDGFYFVGSPDPKNPAFRHIAQTKTYRLKYLNVDSLVNLIPSMYEPFLKVDRETSQVTINAPEEIVKDFEVLLNQIDVAPNQVKISVLVTEISKDRLSELGLQEIGYSFGANQQFNENWQAITGLVSGTLAIQTDVFGTIVAKIAALEEERQAKIKADPWIIAKENKPAKLFVGQREIIIVQPEGAAATIQTVDVGIGLDIVARVVGEDEIEVSLTPSVSYFSNGRTTRTLSTKRNEMSTTLIIRSGQTVAVSGLTVEDDSQSSSGLPLLSRIPLLRYLFGVRSESSEQRELVIFLSVEKL